MEKNNKPLSILQIASGFPGWGGTELHLLNLSNQLTQRGHYVTVACRPDGWVSKKAKEMGLETIDVTVLRQQDWTDFAKIRDWCKQNQIDVMHCHWSTDAFVPAAAARAAGVPVRLMTRHSPYPFKTALGRWIFRELFYNQLLAVSQSVANTLMKCGVPKNKVTVIHHGTDVQEFEKLTQSRELVRQELGLAPADIAVGIVGRIAEEKGHKFLYDALAKLDPSLGVKVVVVGDGPEAEASRTYVEAAGLKDRVIFCPFRTDVNNVFNALDIVTVPSTWEEPCSAVIQQAMALSRPVIGTLAGGTPEMILDGVTGLLVEPSDADSLAVAIGKLAQDPALREQMGAAGHCRVEEHFSLHVMTDKIEELYRRELDRVRGAGTLQKALAS
jgi:glycosyltransferase involved in cell wall biosynthesis